MPDYFSHMPEKTWTQLAQNHYENFPVASFFIRPKQRKAICAVYAFARMADDFADEPAFEGTRSQALKHWRASLEACAGGEAKDGLFKALSEVIQEHNLPVSLFHDLLDAFEQDLVQSRYQSWEGLMDYASKSANPVGRIYLRIFGHDDAQMDAYSDAICTALQFTNFWQDLSVDLPINRLYIPLALMDDCGVDAGDVLAQQASDSFDSLMVELIEKTQALYDQGRELLPMLDGRLRREIGLIVCGGQAMLSKVRAHKGTLLVKRPKLNALEKASLALRMWWV